VSTNNNWRVVPRNATMCWIFLVVGALLLANSVWRMSVDGVAILSVVGGVLAALLMVASVIGLVSPEKRGRW
jgi:hypothetical protein